MDPRAVDYEAEAALLGCMLIDGAQVVKLCGEQRIYSRAFALEKHKRIAHAIWWVYNGKQTVDIILVAEVLANEGKLEEIGGPEALSELAHKIETTKEAGQYLERVREKYLRRRWIEVATRYVEKVVATNPDGVEEAIKKLEDEIERIDDWADRRKEGKR